MALINTEGTVYFSAYLNDTGEIEYGSVAFSAEGRVANYNLYTSAEILHEFNAWFPVSFPQGIRVVRWEDNREYRVEYTNDQITGLVRRKKRK